MKIIYICSELLRKWKNVHIKSEKESKKIAKDN